VTDPTRLWSFVRRFRSDPAQEVLPIDALVSHFTSVFNRTSDPIPIVFCEEFFAVKDQALDLPFTVSELETAVKSLDRLTAPGATGIGNDVLIELFQLPGGPQFLLDFFNACFEGAGYLICGGGQKLSCFIRARVMWPTQAHTGELL
jgi:hypothetical protein